MPEFTHKRYRHYCKTCEDFVLFHVESDSYACDACGNMLEYVRLRDIPEDKRLAQQERFSRKRAEKAMQFLTMYTNPLKSMVDSFNEPHIAHDIIETDAGLVDIEKREKDEREAEKQRIKEEAAEARATFKGMQRNDSCRCGSGVKYKKCCMTRVDKYL